MKIKGLLVLAVWICWSCPIWAQPAPDMIPLQEMTFVGPGGDIGTWPITTAISRVDIRLNGVELHFDKRQGPARWPDNTTPGWQGPLQYSLGIVLRVNGRWLASAPVETWFGANVIGGPIQESCLEKDATGNCVGHLPKNWFYDQRWAPLMGYQPRAGEHIGLFVVAGDARNNFNPVKERSNIVSVTMPAPQTTANFTFSGEVPPPSPSPPPKPPEPPSPSPPEPPSIQPPLQQQFESAVMKRFDSLDAKLEQHDKAPGWLQRFITSPAGIAIVTSVTTALATWQATK